jgi:predicted nucleic acid-binding protein
VRAEGGSVALYIDTSCFLKVFFPQPETLRVCELLSSEARVVVSTLTRLEAASQVHGRVASRLLSRNRGLTLLRRIDEMLEAEPYELVFCPASVIEVAEAQLRALTRAAHCRTLDRLHLATMQALGLQRLLTNDDRQATAARALGFEVSLPR